MSIRPSASESTCKTGSLALIVFTFGVTIPVFGGAGGGGGGRLSIPSGPAGGSGGGGGSLV